MEIQGGRSGDVSIRFGSPLAEMAKLHLAEPHNLRIVSAFGSPTRLESG